MNQLRPLSVPSSSAGRPASNKVAAKGPALLVRRRPDLKAVQTNHKHDSAVVIKDPIAMKYHRMRPDEFFVWEQLDGQTSLESIRSAYELRFAPYKVTTAELNQLIFRFHQNGLTVSDVSLQGERLRERSVKERKQRWMQHITGVLFIRFPGVDPEPLLRRIYPLVRPLFSKSGIVAWTLLAIASLYVFAIHYDSFVSQFPAMGQWIQLKAVLILAAVIGGTKILHELGHALVCKHFGGECHQIGPMLLVFTPALYCDTSDSWMLSNRFQRAAVGLAGIATEVMLAAIATIVWASTADGIVHYTAMNVMLVCSVSTLLFNANPLLRYDGYFVLSDLVDVPNLAEKSRRLLAAYANDWLLGVDELPTDPMSTGERIGLLVYAVAAFVYRWTLTLAILWLVGTLLTPYGLQSVGRLLCLFATGGMLFALFRAPVKFLRNPARRKNIRMNRLMTSAAVAVVLLVAAAYPIPSGVSVVARVVPHQETPLFVATSGILRVLHRSPGDQVREGDKIATLENADVELQYATIQGRQATQAAKVESMQRAALDSIEVANELPNQISLLRDLDQQLETHAKRRDGLVIQSPADGQLIAAPRRNEEPDAVAKNRLVSWSGYPTDPRNQGCYLEPGFELMSIVGDDRWDAEVVLDQSEVERIFLGSDVKMVLEAKPSVKLQGRVTEIARTEFDDSENGQRRDDPNAARSGNPLATSYMVRIELDETGDAPMIVGAAAAARIEATEISVIGRASRWLSGLLRFR
ncbi:Putative peptide zinc metalloprotease protein YydH [Rubripirellula lacrimiformis]|uniref:Peptide zinc metalloprotease protein YydH n=1 Tax=Rubripirellula lacrimiformis TaxID=1930273 RepID=A0A517NBZ0_9BACT|nr:M50 family metallopeptidase [Rubripirellula lacrimiformis]QDT04652.1 Putative peptide zinc metalloprotease protein YydH [Rubripirellula lacrimiformis]